MENLAPEISELLSLGIAVGQSQAFALVAGRCSAAQAQAFLRIREEKLYKRCADTWKEFCPRFLKMSSSQIDRIIRLWQQHGAGIFELSQLTRISPELYRAIEPHIQDGAVHFNGEVIELDPVNSEKVTAIVAEMRRTLPPAASSESAKAGPVDRFEKVCDQLINHYIDCTGLPLGAEEFDRFRRILDGLNGLLFGGPPATVNP
jgi:hypothetical protein